MSDTIDPGAAAPAGAALDARLAGLSPEKRALLEKRLLAKRAKAEEPPAVTPRTQEGPVPLSYVQELMWLVHELSPGTHAYNSSGARRIIGPLDVDALQAAIDGVVARHESLRTTFDLRGDVPMQIIHDEVHLELERIEAPGMGDEELLDLLRRLVRRPFDLRVPPLLRATLVELGPEEHVLLTSANHIVWDGWSKGIYFRELAELYDARLSGREPQLPELGIQYADYAIWQREWLSGERLEGQLDYWRKQLAGAPPLLELPTDRPRPAVAEHRGDRMELWLPGETLEGLKALARAHGVTLYMVLVATWTTLLHRWTGQDDLVLGTPVAGRNRTEVEGLIGYFNNTLALRVDCSGDPTFAELLGRVREVALGAYAHQDVSFEQVVREVAPQRDLSYSPVFQTLIVLQNAAQEKLSLRGVTMDMIVTESGTSKFDLSLGMGEHEGKLHASFEYDSALFDRETVARVREQWGTLVEGVVADAGVRLSEVPLLRPEQETELLSAGRGPAVPREDATLHGLFARRAAEAPGAVAVRSAGGELTYAQLDARRRTLAAQLQGLGAGPGARVGVLVPRSPELVAGALGILSAGAACVPLDVEYPDERLAQMVRAAGVEHVVTDVAHVARVEALGATAVLPQPEGTVAPVDGAPEAAPGDVAYVLFTSGSTGEPKGVELEHGGLVNEALAMIGAYGFGAADRVLQFASISFDISLEETYCALLSGATLVQRSPAVALGGRAFVDWLSAERITVMDLPTAFWHEWVADLLDGGLEPPASLRLLIVGGEKASADALVDWRRVAPDVRWVNTYGPTEASIVATAWEPPAGWQRVQGRDLPIGRPLANVSAHVLDARGRVVPAGLRGELCIGGAGVARGYLGRPDDTAAKFAEPPGLGERVYRTGDVVRRNADGDLEYLGRTDQQLKFRGFRIEPGEVEAALATHAKVSSALVVLREDAPAGPALVGYVVVEGDAQSDLGDAVRRYVADLLPTFAVPDAVVALEALPLTANGKVDRDALPLPELAAPSERVEPRTDAERELAAIWTELLGREPGVTEDFFAIGGHSMMAVRMFGLIERRMGVRLPLTALMRTPTIAGLAQVVEAERASDDEWQIVVPLRTGDDAKPPLWLLHTMDGELLVYREMLEELAEDQPIWGIRAVGLDNRQVPDTELPVMARRYVAEIRRRQPEGPYLFAGRCFGGVIAYEMASQLEAEGVDVAFVGVIDGIPFGMARNERMKNAVREVVVKFRNRPPSKWPGTAYAVLRTKAIRTSWRVRWQLARRLYVDRGRPMPERLLDRTLLSRVAARGYETPVYGGRVDVFRAFHFNGGVDNDRRLRWREFAKGGVEVHNVTTDGVTHQTLMKGPHAAMLGRLVQDAVDRAAERS